MKVRTIHIGIPLLALIFGLILTSCIIDDYGGQKYTLWSGTTSYSVFSEVIDDLSDGYFFNEELTDAEFTQISKHLSNKNKHSWTEYQIQDYLAERGFGYDQADQETSTFLNYRHGFIAVRSGSTVHIIIR
ncbi:hypothetical protein R84B8_01935 [Treponema sp. R8-4-B8]